MRDRPIRDTPVARVVFILSLFVVEFLGQTTVSNTAFGVLERHCPSFYTNFAHSYFLWRVLAGSIGSFSAGLSASGVGFHLGS